MGGEEEEWPAFALLLWITSLGCVQLDMCTPSDTAASFLAEYMFVHSREKIGPSSILPNSSKLEMTQMSINRRMGECL